MIQTEKVGEGGLGTGGRHEVSQVKEKRTQKAQVENKIGISSCWTCEAKTKQVQMNQNNLLTMSVFNENPNKEKKKKMPEKRGCRASAFRKTLDLCLSSLTHLVFVLTSIHP